MVRCRLKRTPLIDELYRNVKGLFWYKVSTLPRHSFLQRNEMNALNSMFYVCLMAMCFSRTGGRL